MDTRKLTSRFQNNANKPSETKTTKFYSCQVTKEKNYSFFEEEENI